MGIPLEIKLTDNQINTLVQQYVSKCYSKSDVENRIYSYGTKRISKKIDQMIDDGTLLDAIAKQIAKNISIEQLVGLIDKDHLNEVVAERISKCLINKINISL